MINPNDVPVSGYPDWILTKIKANKSVCMSGNEEVLHLELLKSGTEIYIPMKVIFNVSRGIESYKQRFYRKNVKTSK